MSKEKKLETEVVLCTGKTDIFKEVLFTFDPAVGLPFFIEDVNVKLQDVDLNAINGECCDAVIFSGNLFINVIYKVGGTVVDDANGFPTSDDFVRHQTKLVPISGCIPMDCDKVKKCDKNVKAKLLDVCISENHILTNPVAENPASPFPIYNNLREQVCIKIKAKVVTDEIVTLKFEDEDDKDRKCKC